MDKLYTEILNLAADAARKAGTFIREARKTGLQVNLFGISSADEWQTDVTVSSRKVDDIFGSATLKDVPFRANRITEYSGPLFGTIGELEMSLNTTWDSSYEGTW